MEGESAHWFLKEWAALAKRRQTDMVNDLGWAKNTVNRLWHGHQHYSRKQVQQAADWLGIQPYELLMHPREAHALRALRRNAEWIVHGGPQLELAEEPAPPPARPSRRRA